MRFGAAFFPSMPVDEVTAIARLAEDLGYADLWIPDQSFHHDPFLLLARCADATSVIRLGVAVTNPVSRHPVQIARAAATLGMISEGRFVLGLGAGNRTRVLPALGLPTDRPVARIAEAIDVCRRLLRGEQVSVSGPTLSLSEVRLDVGAVPEIPIFVGSRGPRILRIAGAMADGVFVEAMFTPEGLDYAMGEVEGGARDAGRDASAVEMVAWQAIKLSTTIAAADDGRYRTWAAAIMRSTREDVLERIGIPRDTIRSVIDTFRASGEWAAGSLVPDDVVSRLLLVGDPGQIHEQVQTVEDRGIDSLSIIGFGTTEVVQDTLRRFALDVMDRSAR
ncbi:MAG: LLM class flavin-dependent oxidoreductase [Actinomycetota bacterium]